MKKLSILTWVVLDSPLSFMDPIGGLWLQYLLKHLEPCEGCMLMLLLSFGAAWLLEQPSSSLPPTLQVLDDQELRGIGDPGHVDLLAI